MKNYFYFLIIQAFFILGFQNCSYAFLYVTNPSTNEIFQYDQNSGDFLKKIAVPHGTYSFLTEISTGPDNNIYLSVSEMGGYGRLLEYEGDTGEFLKPFVNNSVMGLGGDAVFGGDGYVYTEGCYGSGSSEFIHRWTESGGNGSQFITFSHWDNREGQMTDFELGPDGNIYVSNNTQIVKYNRETGAYMGVFSDEGAFDFVFGADHNIYASFEDSVMKYDGLTGESLGVFCDSYGVLRFGPDSNLYVGNLEKGIIQRYDGITGGYLGDVAPLNTYYGFASFTFAGDNSAPVPEPSTIILLGMSLFGFFGLKIRKITK